MNYTKLLFKRSWIAFIIFLLFGGSACKKNVGEAGNHIGTILDSAAKMKLALLKETSLLLEQVYTHREAYFEVNATIYSGYYEDERVLLKDLLFPDASALYQREKFKIFHSGAGRFRDVFLEAVRKGNFPLLQAALLQANRSGNATSNSTTVGAADLLRLSGPLRLMALETAIYFPYSENFITPLGEWQNDEFMKTSPSMSATIVNADREADAAPGREPYPCAQRISFTACYREVLVDDEYASAKPTHIVTSGASPASAEPSAEMTPEMVVNRVYHGWSRLTRQLDKLISFTSNGGGSEIKIARISGYLQTKEQQIASFSGDLVTVHYKRGDIRNKRWRRVFSVWDTDWKPDNKEQVYAVYEDDTQGTKKIKGSLSTTLSIPGKPSPGKVAAEIGFDISVLTQDDIITQRKYDRYAYFRDAFNSQGWGYVMDASDFLPTGKDWPIFDGGTIWNYTLPYRIG